MKKWACLIDILFTVQLYTVDFAKMDDAFFSQAKQDQFVYLILYHLLGKQDSGTYLEIGAGDPIEINNSYFFEKNFQWKGISIDHSEAIIADWKRTRSNPLLSQDALRIDYVALLQDFPREIDYLSLDVDNVYDLVLLRIPFDSHLFKLITIEHDAYRFGDRYRHTERQILWSYGYYLVCSNVSIGETVFEDWWIHSSVIPERLFPFFTSLDLHSKECSEIIRTLQKLCVN
jgi:hypothetical protein